MKKKITSWEVIILSTVFVFLAGLIIEGVNFWLAGNYFWSYVTEWGVWPEIFDRVIFGTVPVGVLFGWTFTGVLVGVFTSLVAKRIG